MTIRSAINRKKRWIATAACTGLVLFVGGTAVTPQLLPQTSQWLIGVGLAGFALGFLAMVYGSTFAFRCPKCRAWWSYIAMSHGMFSLDRRIKYCPYCGFDVDLELPADPIG